MICTVAEPQKEVASLQDWQMVSIGDTQDLPLWS